MTLSSPRVGYRNWEMLPPHYCFPSRSPLMHGHMPPLVARVLHWNHIHESTYLAVMLTKPIPTATWESASLLRTAITWFWGMRVQVAFQVILRLCSGTQFTSGDSRGRAEKSLVMQLKKCIYSTYFHLSSAYFWLHCSNFFNPFKQNSFGYAENRKSHRLISTPTYIGMLPCLG
jgi:hypothetical protein